MIDIMWLMEQYEAQKVGYVLKCITVEYTLISIFNVVFICRNCPLTVVYGYEFPNMKEYMEKKLPNVTHHLVNMKDPFGTHHS